MEAHKTDSGLSITVWDTGIGIPDDKKHLLFQPFQQLDSSLSRKHEGTGLGLVLTKKLVDMHGGSITFESKEGAGTSFTVNLPEMHLAEPGTQAEISEPEASGGTGLHVSGRKIMVVEDNRLNMVLAVDYLKLNDFEVIEASDGEQALLKVSSERPDLILMDIQMPGIDGLEVTRRLKQDPSTRAIPIIAMTALAMRGDENMCLNGGCDDYIRKPVNLDDMIATIEKRLLVR
jgi:CheY-like chemotaxis protein